MNNFQTVQQKLADASAAAADAAKQNVVDAYEKATRLKFNIQIKAPIIYVPVHSQSRRGIALDLGYLKLTNVISDIVVEDNERSPAVLDEIKLNLKDIKVLNVIIENNASEVSVKSDAENILDPINCEINVSRNISSSWYQEKPDLDISVYCQSIILNLKSEDYKLILLIIEKNLTEGTESKKQVKSQARSVAVSKPEPGVVKTLQKEDITETETDEIALKIYEKFKLNIKLDAIISNLFLDTENGLATLGLHYLSIKSTTYSNETNSYAILLSNINIDDTRTDSQSMIKRYLGTKESVNKSQGVGETPMLDITALLKENDTFAKINICGINLIMSIDFMTEIADFFLTPIPETNTDPSVKIKVEETYQTQEKCEMVNLNKKLQLIVHIEEPDIILTENLDDINANAIVLNAKMDMNYRMVGTKQVISGEINDLKMYMCSVLSENRDSTKHYIIHPCVISLHGSPPDGYGLHMNLIFSEIIINISPGTIELINKAMNTINTQSIRKTIILPEKNDYSKIWEYKNYEESDFWFFKCDEGIDALTFQCASPEKESKPEKCIIEMKSLIVVFETGMGYYTAQKLFTKMNFNVTVSNWSDELNVNGDLTLSTQYYNSELAVWEPLIEPNERYTKTGEIVYDPWDLSFSLDIIPQRDENDELSDPLKKIVIHSEKILQILISKTSLELLNSLSAEFSEALEVSGLRKPEIIAPYIVENDTGSDITLHFSKSIFTLHDCHTSLKHKDDLNKSLVITGLSKTPFRTKDITSCTLQRNGKVYLQTKQLSESDEFDSEPHLFVQISDLPQQVKLPVSKAVTRYYSLNEHAKQRTWGIVSEVTTKYGTSKINIHGIVVVHNHFSVALSVHRYVSRKQEKIEVGTIAPGKSFNVPLYAIYGDHKELYFALKGYDVSVQGIKWNEEPSNPHYVKQLQCDPLDNFEPFYINAIREKTEIYHENTNKYSLLSSYFTINLRPPLCLRNCLPVEIKVSVAGCSVRNNFFNIANDEEINENEDMLDYGEKIIFPGNVIQLPTFRLRKKVHEAKSYLVVRIINYLEKDWSCTTEIPEEALEFEVWNFSSYDSVVKMEMNLGIWFENYHGSQMLTIYSPFWMINKTGLMLSYKSSMEPHNILYHPPEYNGPILFSFRDQNFFDRKRAFVRIDNGEWSERIPLEVAGSIGSITCGLDDIDYQIGVHNHLSSNTLTKQITFLPFYTIVNKCDYDIEIQSPSHPTDPWIQISSNQCIAYWPKSKELLLVVRVFYTKFHTIPFLVSEEQCILLKLENSKYGAINVDVHMTEGGVFITMTEYNPGDAPGLFINHTSKNIIFKEEGNLNERLLEPQQHVLFTWSEITNDMKVLFKTDTDCFDTNLKQDGIGNVLIGETTGYWVSFLDGLQRVILITENGVVAHNAECSAVLQKLTQSIEIRIQGIGLSLINNIRSIDILYVGIMSSTASWESRKLGKARFKQMKATSSSILEKNYKQYMLNKERNQQQKYYLEGNKVEIDFEKMILLKSPEYEIQRTLYPGVWLTRKTSPFQTQFHVKINRIQIDNQILECIFPVILAPIAPPKSVADTSAKKPFIEFSVVKRVIPHSNIEQYKYLNMLMQTFYIKVDLLFINAIAEMFSTELTDEQAAKLFTDNVASIKKPLSELVKSKSLKDQKNFYDNLHLGPLKIHLSFSMAGADTKSLPPILSTIIESVGVTLTDVNDVVFKLAYFQREYKFLTQTQLQDEITAHYTGQALKQLYVLVLGLDVLGDPYGLVVGFKKGVEDLFYEPFQGAIQGPGEFAEGLVLGVKSLFGHTVGGAAGAVSKITGAMGTCLATLTFDEEYKKKRRQATNKIPRNFNQGIARSGKDLVMGVVDGVTGVFTKPVAGARDQGFGGFFKGLGQGAIGLVARPTAGVVDFASESLDAVKRATSDSQYTHRLRPSRHFSEDGVIRPYCTHLANGDKLLKEVDKGKYAHTDLFQEMFETKAKTEYLLITNNRIMEVHKNNIYGTYSIKWSYRWPEIDSIVEASNAIYIMIKRENKLRAFSQDKKIIPVPDPDRRDKLRKLMEDLRTRI